MSEKSQDPKWNFAFKDQPNGKCSECRWNMKSVHGGLDCTVPMTHLTNTVCMMKMQTQLMLNFDLRAEEIEDDDGNDWKEDASL